MSNQNIYHMRIPYSLSTSAATTLTLLDLTFDSTFTVNLADISSNLTYLKAMYRFYRLKNFKVSVRSGSTFTTPNGAVCLSFLPAGSVVADYSEAESMNIIPIDLIPGSDQTKNVLNVPSRNITQNTAWKTTDSSAVAEDIMNYGRVQLLSASGETFTASQKLLVMYEFEIEFKQLMDWEASSKIFKIIDQDSSKKQNPNQTNT